MHEARPPFLQNPGGLAALIFYRCYFFTLVPGDRVPTYCINKGAMAISRLAGSLPIRSPICNRDERFSMVSRCSTGLAGQGLPLQVILGVWRHAIRGYRFVYDPLYRGLVFPLGRYAVAPEHMSRSMGLAFLCPVSVVFLYVEPFACGGGAGSGAESACRRPARCPWAACHVTGLTRRVTSSGLNACDSLACITEARVRRGRIGLVVRAAH